MWFCNRAYLEIIYCNYSKLLYDVRAYPYASVYTCLFSVAALCIAILLFVAAAAVLLLPAAARHRMPGDIFFAPLLLVPVFSFSSFKHDLLLMYTFGSID